MRSVYRREHPGAVGAIFAGSASRAEHIERLYADPLGQTGDGPALATGDIVEPALESEALFQSMSVTPDLVAALHRLATLEPRTLAIMHGTSLAGNCKAALEAFAAGIARQRLPAAA